MEDLCPYYKPDYKRCNISDTHQDNEYNRNHYCRSKDNFKKCANYEGASYASKRDKALRHNPDL